MLDRLGARAVLALLAAGVALPLVGCLETARESQVATPTSAPAVTARPTSTSTGTPTSTPIPIATRTPLPTPGPLTDAEAVALIEEEMTARRVASDTLRISVAGEPRMVSIRYASSYAIDSRVFQAETVLITLVVARTVARIKPPVRGGTRLAVVPAGDSDVGLRVTVIESSSLEAWHNGSISDQEFISQWAFAAVTKE